MKLLAIETATEACSAALYLEGETRERYQVEAQGHSRLILPMMDDLLAEAGISLAQLDALAFGRGPGSFTGVRIATGVVQGAAFAAALPVVPVSTLAALAQGAHETYGDRQILTALDARMQEVYWGAYGVGDDALVALQGDEVVCPANRVPVPEGDVWIGVGPGWAAYSEVLCERLGSRGSTWRGDLLPHAHHVARLAAADVVKGHAVPAEQALPVYLRDNVASKERKSV